MEDPLPQPSPILETLRRGAPRRSPTVRTLANYSGHVNCPLASLGYAAGVDFDRLLDRTEFEAPFGQSPFAFGRGKAFERIVAANGYGNTLALLRDRMGFQTTDAKVVNLRESYPPNRAGMVLRANETRRLLRQIVDGHPYAPNLIDGAVLATRIAGVTAHFEADAIAARFGDRIHVGEIKSFPIVDERADPDKLGAAFDQVALYVLLLQEAISSLGGDPSLVSTDAMLIAPRNVGMRPTLALKDIRNRIRRMERLLSHVPSIDDLITAIPPGASFAVVADRQRPDEDRIGALHDLADAVGTIYVPDCLSTCGLGRFCRARAFADGSPSLTGSKTIRLLPGVPSLDRAAELISGAPPSDREAPVAAQLRRAGRLYDERLRSAGGAT